MAAEGGFDFVREVLFRGYVSITREHPEQVAHRTVVEAMQAKLGTLSLEAQSKLEKDTAKKEAKAEAKADAALKKKMVGVPGLPQCLRTHFSRSAGITGGHWTPYLHGVIPSGSLAV